MAMLENRGVEYIPIARYVGHRIPTVVHKTYSGESRREISLTVANQIRYRDVVEEDAMGPLVASVNLK